MNFQSMMAQMDSNAQVLHALVKDCSEHQARWKPDPDTWSVLEVVNHLLDEERDDFRAHIDLLLHHCEDPWPRIDPQGWVVERGYNQRDLGESLAEFAAARDESLAWLRGLGEVAWTVEYTAPFGTIRAGDLLASWGAHDVLHMRQLVRLKWAYLLPEVEPYGVRYAGVW